MHRTNRPERRAIQTNIEHGHLAPTKPAPIVKILKGHDRRGKFVSAILSLFSTLTELCVPLRASRGTPEPKPTRPLLWSFERSTRLKQSDLGTGCSKYLFRFARNPISWTGANHEASTLDDYPDFVKSALIDVVRRVTEHVLGVEFLSEFLERFV